MNNHPLSDDLTKLGSDDLDKRYVELVKRFNIARRMNMSQDVIYQIDLMLEGIEFEKMRRLSTLDQNDNPVVLDTDWETKEKK